MVASFQENKGPEFASAVADNAGEPPEVRLKSKKYANEYWKEIGQKPEFPCASCCMLHYRKTVRRVTFEPDAENEGQIKIFTGDNVDRKGAEKKCNALWLQLYDFVKKKKMNEKEIYVCNTCFPALTGGQKHSSVSVFNRLEVQETPPELACLNDFERQLTQKAKCFQTVISLGTVGSRMPD